MDALALRRRAAALSLALGALLVVVDGVASLPLTFPQDPTEHLGELRANLNASRVSAYAFIASQIFLLVGVVGLLPRFRERGATLAHVAVALVVIGCFAHAVVGGLAIATLEMVFDPERYAPLYGIVQRSPLVLPFHAAGILGFALGFLLLAAAIHRARIAPLWLPIALAVGLVVEFAGAAASGYAALAGRLVFAVALVALAFPLHRRGQALLAA